MGDSKNLSVRGGEFKLKLSGRMQLGGMLSRSVGMFVRSSNLNSTCPRRYRSEGMPPSDS